MNSSRLCVHQLRQGVDVSVLQLGRLSIFQNLRRQWMLHCQRLQHICIGTDSGLGFFDDRQFQSFEQQQAQLLGTIQIDLFTAAS